MYPHIKFGVPTSNNYRGYAPDTNFLELRPGQGQGHSDTETVCHILGSQNVSTHQIWEFCLEKYWRYMPWTQFFTELRPEIKVTMTQKQYAT